MPSDRPRRVFLSGATPAKVIMAVVSVCAAAGVLVYDVTLLTEEAPATNAGTFPARMDGDDVPLVPGPESGGNAPHAAPHRDGGGADDDASVASGPSATAAAGPDWAVLFDKLIEREQLLSNAGGTTPDPSPVDLDAPPTERGGAPETGAVDDHALRGIVRHEGGGRALVDGRLLRVGDVLPGSDLLIEAILEDRILLAVPGAARPRTLLMEPLRNGSSGTRQGRAAPVEQPSGDA